MKITNFQQMTKENFPSKYHDLVDTIAYPINNAFQQIINAFNSNQITVTDNLNQQYKTISITVDASGNPVQTTTYKSTLTGRTQGIIVINAVNTTSSTTYPTSCPFISFIDNSGTVTINNVSGLQANQKYTLTILSTA